MLNLAEFWLVTMILGGAYCLFTVLKFLAKIFKKKAIERKSRDNLDQFKFNAPIRHLLEFYIELVLFSLVQIIQVITNRSTLYIFSFTCSFVFVVISFGLPYFIYRAFLNEDSMDVIT
jgi:hypothetical protein